MNATAGGGVLGRLGSQALPLLVQTASGHMALAFNRTSSTVGTALVFTTNPNTAYYPWGTTNFYASAVTMLSQNTGVWTAAFGFGAGAATGSSYHHEFNGTALGLGYGGYNFGVNAQGNNAAAFGLANVTSFVYNGNGSTAAYGEVNGQVVATGIGTGAAALGVPPVGFVGLGGASNLTTVWRFGIGGNINAAGASDMWQGTVGDVIVFGTNTSPVTLSQRYEVDAYQAIKYGTAGTVVSSTSSLAALGSGVTGYDLSSSTVANTLLDQVLDLSATNTAATVLTEGADAVLMGSGNDKVYINDLQFRQIDAGMGDNTLALGPNYHDKNTIVLADFVSNARGNGADTAANTRVNTAGYHKLMGFEHIDLSTNAGAQMLTVSADDVNQLAAKNLAGDPQAAPNTSNLYVVMDAGDAVVPVGLTGGNAFGYWVDAQGHSYDYKLSGTSTVNGVTYTDNLFGSGGVFAPSYANTGYGATYSTAGKTTTVTLNFDKAVMPTSALAVTDFTMNDVALTSGNASMSWDTSKTTLTLSFTGASALSGVVRLVNSDPGAITDPVTGLGLRYRDVSVGSANGETIDGSSRSSTQALFGGGGDDRLIGGSGSDLLEGGPGNNTLTGGGGADTFRFIKGQTGADHVTDFNVGEGDKLDLRGLLAGTGFNATTNLANYLSFSSVSLSAGSTTPAGTKLTLKVDATGNAAFGSPTETIYLDTFTTPAAGLALTGTGSTDLNTLLTQRVLLV